MQALEDALSSWRLRSRFRIPANESALIAEIHRVGHVLELRYEGSDAVIVAHIPPHLEQKLAELRSARLTNQITDTGFDVGRDLRPAGRDRWGLTQTGPAPIANLIATGRGMLRSAGRASKVPTRPHGTTGTLVSATSIPSPCLKGIIDPLRLRPPSGKMMKIARSSCNFRRRSASACVPQFFRHIGKALSTIAENVLVTFVWKKTSPAAMGKARSRWRGVSAAPRASASRWLQ